ncbi:MAG: hypothetical protein IMZ62_12915 [Chloroflexi bacterium]|nr:hypothetical protein [Chloroflexota bacterium]MBE3119105.1 hypothetical protein [Candidatus Atribacteria bacterium]
MTIRPVPPAEFFLNLSAAATREWVLERDARWRQFAVLLMEDYCSSLEVMRDIRTRIEEVGK